MEKLNKETVEFKYVVDCILDAVQVLHIHLHIHISSLITF